MQVNPHINPVQKIALYVEGDEQWSYVQSKKNQRWLWYFLDQATKKIVAYVFGPRTDETFKKLLKLVEHFPISHIFTDDWQAYKRCLTNVRHTVSKKFTQNIERMNLNLRIHIKRLSRKTLCFSKSEIIHDKLIGTYIQNNHFN